MAYRTIKEIAEMCCKTPTYININVKRGKLIAEEKQIYNKLQRAINTENETNVLFLAKWKVKDFEEIESQINKRIKTEEKPKQKLQSKKSKPKPKTKTINTNQSTSTIIQEKNIAELEQKKLLIEKTKREIEKIEIANQKALGNIIPIDAINFFLPEVLRSLSKSMEKEAENIINEIIAITGSTNDQRVKCIERLRLSIGRANKTALSSIKNNIETLTNKYVEKREVGQHD